MKSKPTIKGHITFVFCAWSLSRVSFLSEFWQYTICMCLCGCDLRCQSTSPCSEKADSLVTGMSVWPVSAVCHIDG